jgi:hypothetical protein
MAGRAGALDRRLWDWSQVTAAVIEAVLRDHDCEGSDSCPACGNELTGKRSPCRSAVVARAARCGRRPQWVAEPGSSPAVQAAPDEDTAPGLFAVEPFRKGGGR